MSKTEINVYVEQSVMEKLARSSAAKAGGKFVPNKTDTADAFKKARDAMNDFGGAVGKAVTESMQNDVKGEGTLSVDGVEIGQVSSWAFDLESGGLGEMFAANATAEKADTVKQGNYAFDIYALRNTPEAERKTAEEAFYAQAKPGQTYDEFMHEQINKIAAYIKALPQDKDITIVVPKWQYKIAQLLLKKARATKHMAIMTAENDRLEQRCDAWFDEIIKLKQEVNALLPADKPRYATSDTVGELSVNGVKIGNVIYFNLKSGGIDGENITAMFGASVFPPDATPSPYQRLIEKHKALVDAHKKLQRRYMNSQAQANAKAAQAYAENAAHCQNLQIANDEVHRAQQELDSYKHDNSYAYLSVERERVITAQRDALTIDRDNIALQLVALKSAAENREAEWQVKDQTWLAAFNQEQAARIMAVQKVAAVEDTLTQRNVSLKASNVVLREKNEQLRKEVEALNTLAVSRVQYEKLAEVSNSQGAEIQRLREFQGKWITAKTLSEKLGKQLYAVADALGLPKTSENTRNTQVLMSCATEVQKLQNDLAAVRKVVAK